MSSVVVSYFCLLVYAQLKFADAVIYGLKITMELMKINIDRGKVMLNKIG